MNRLTIGSNGRQFKKDGATFRLVVDTAWSVFVDASEPDWREYLLYRQGQGFNTIAVSFLPILHDRVEWDGASHPFELHENGTYDFDRINSMYFANVRRYCEIASEYGMTLAIVLLWCNYVPDSWGSKLTPGSVMSRAQRHRYISSALASIADFSPILVISGDDHFSEPASVEAYLDALAQARREAPECLTTMHSSPLADLPASIADSPHLDFYTYQSGHFFDRQHLAWQLADLYATKPIVRPVINLEPCYEQLGTAEGTYRFQRPDVRRAIWLSVLGGASAGIGYGSHGIWQWYSGQGVVRELGPWLEPFHWRSAIEQPGAEDAVFAMKLVRQEELGALSPNPSVMTEGLEGFFGASNADETLIAVYAPFCRSVVLKGEASGFALEAWDLERRQRVSVNWESHDPPTLPQIDRSGDFLFVARAPKTKTDDAVSTDIHRFDRSDLLSDS